MVPRIGVRVLSPELFELGGPPPAGSVSRAMGSLIKKRRKRMRKKKHKKMLRRTRHQRQRGK